MRVDIWGFRGEPTRTAEARWVRHRWRTIVFLLGGLSTLSPGRAPGLDPEARSFGREPVQPQIEVGVATGRPGETVPLAVSLRTRGLPVAAAQNDLLIDPEAPFLRAASGRPDCTVNPAIDKSASAFAYLPAGCLPEACTGIRSIIFAADNSDPIPDGSVLYTCRLRIRDEARAAVRPVNAAAVTVSDPEGEIYRGVTTAPGEIRILAVPTSTSTASPSSTPTNTLTRTPTVPPSLTPTVTFSPSPAPTATPSRTATSSPSRTASPVPSPSSPPTPTASAIVASSPTRSATMTPSLVPTSTRTAPPSATGTASPSPAASATATATPLPSGSPSPTPTGTASPSSTPEPLPCGGDCDRDREVTIDEILRLVNVALGLRPLADCPVGDSDGDGSIAINDIIAAVGSALNGCPQR